MKGEKNTTINDNGEDYQNLTAANKSKGVALTNKKQARPMQAGRNTHIGNIFLLLHDEIALLAQHFKT